MQSNEELESLRDRSVRDIHLEKGYKYEIELNLKSFAVVVSVLSKFNEQILLQPVADGLLLLASNSAKSAHAKIMLTSKFFDHCEAPDQSDGEAFCRLSTKSALHVFRGIGHSTVLSCTIELDPYADNAIIHMRHHSQINSCYVLALREHVSICDNVHEKQRLKNKVTVQPKVMLSFLATFDCRDLEFDVSATKFIARRHISREESRKVKTELNITVDHFELYHIHMPSRIVINLRELRPVLHFAEACCMALTLHFDLPGRPLIVSTEENVEFQADFVLGTLDDVGPPVQNSTAVAVQQSQSRVASMVQQRESLFSSSGNDGTSAPVQPSQSRIIAPMLQQRESRLLLSPIYTSTPLRDANPLRQQHRTPEKVGPPAQGPPDKNKAAGRGTNEGENNGGVESGWMSKKTASQSQQWNRSFSTFNFSAEN